MLTSKPVWPDSTDSWLYLTGACVTASIATFSSNAAVKYISPGLASIAQNTDIIGSGYWMFSSGSMQRAAAYINLVVKLALEYSFL